MRDDHALVLLLHAKHLLASVLAIADYRLIYFGRSAFPLARVVAEARTGDDAGTICCAERVDIDYAFKRIDIKDTSSALQRTLEGKPLDAFILQQIAVLQGISQPSSLGLTIS